MSIYLDHGATTPMRPEAIALVTEIWQHQWGNPSSIHAWGERSAMVVERARYQVANLINADIDVDNIIFTAGGTEADNLAILGITQHYTAPQHIISSVVEHSAIAQTLNYLENLGWQITRLPVDSKGRVHPDDLQSSLQPNTVLVSIIYGQNEVGTLQPIKQLGEICRAAGVIFHTDAVQVAGHLPINLQALPVDMLSLSSHKIYGPQGVGALYVRQNINLLPVLRGGGQESGLRSGTQAVGAIAGFGLAAALAHQELASEVERLTNLRDYLFDLVSDLPDLIPTGDFGKEAERLPHHLSFCHKYINGRELVRAMDRAGIAISSGSACSSGTVTPNSVLLAMGYKDKQALGAIRLTLGRSTTMADIETTARTLHQILQKTPVSI